MKAETYSRTMLHQVNCIPQSSNWQIGQLIQQQQSFHFLLLGDGLGVCLQMIWSMKCEHSFTFHSLAHVCIINRLNLPKEKVAQIFHVQTCGRREFISYRDWVCYLIAKYNRSGLPFDLSKQRCAEFCKILYVSNRRFRLPSHSRYTHTTTIWATVWKRKWNKRITFLRIPSLWLNQIQQLGCHITKRNWMSRKNWSRCDVYNDTKKKWAQVRRIQ